MSPIKHSTISFLFAVLVSKALVPFLALLYGVLFLKNALSFWSLCVLSGFSFVTFSFILGDVLKHMRIRYVRKDLWVLGFGWAFCALVIQIIYDPMMWSDAFCFCHLWPYVLLGLFLAPRFCGIYARQWSL